jgi:hypothetical protein
MIFSNTLEEHAEYVREVLSKCVLSTNEVEFLGYRVGVKGVSMDPRVQILQL